MARGPTTCFARCSGGDASLTAPRWTRGGDWPAPLFIYFVKCAPSPARRRGFCSFDRLDIVVECRCAKHCFGIFVCRFWLSEGRRDMSYYPKCLYKRCI